MRSKNKRLFRRRQRPRGGVNRPIGSHAAWVRSVTQSHLTCPGRDGDLDARGHTGEVLFTHHTSRSYSYTVLACVLALLGVGALRPGAGRRSENTVLLPLISCKDETPISHVCHVPQCRPTAANTPPSLDPRASMLRLRAPDLRLIFASLCWVCSRWTLLAPLLAAPSFSHTAPWHTHAYASVETHTHTHSVGD